MDLTNFNIEKVWLCIEMKHKGAQNTKLSAVPTIDTIATSIKPNMGFQNQKKRNKRKVVVDHVLYTMQDLANLTGRTVKSVNGYYDRLDSADFRKWAKNELRAHGKLKNSKF